MLAIAVAAAIIQPTGFDASPPSNVPAATLTEFDAAPLKAVPAALYAIPP